MELNNAQQGFVEKFKKEIHDRPFDVDPNGEEHWRSLTIGWAIGKGMEPEDARNFAHYIRYHSDLG